MLRLCGFFRTWDHAPCFVNPLSANNLGRATPGQTRLRSCAIRGFCRDSPASIHAYSRSFYSAISAVTDSRLTTCAAFLCDPRYARYSPSPPQRDADASPPRISPRLPLSRVRRPCPLSHRNYPNICLLYRCASPAHYSPPPARIFEILRCAEDITSLRFLTCAGRAKSAGAACSLARLTCSPPGPMLSRIGAS